jgi:glycosyltransferase involved in cell wall biosynthesis
MIGGEYHSEPGLMTTLAALAAKVGVADRIDFKGHQTTGMIVEELASSAIYLQPSRYESQGLAIMEAMASGLPVIAARLPAIEEYLEDGVNGLLVRPDSPEATADALSYLMAHKELAVAMGAVNRVRGSAADWAAACDLTLAALGYGAR